VEINTNKRRFGVIFSCEDSGYRNFVVEATEVLKEIVIVSF